ncbi:adhesion G-protein coupled receptor G2-like [Channa argus]|uniref:adhesion G-protein coupled receptor G2-like n=1 Tax=Channa argus TaxID=215402 RepID=UPI0035203077
MKWQLVCWLILSLQTHCFTHCPRADNIKRCLKDILPNPTNCDLSSTLKLIEGIIINSLRTLVTVFTCQKYLVAVLVKPETPFTGLTFSANDVEAMPNIPVTRSIVNVQLPRELDVGRSNTIMFWMFTLDIIEWTMCNQTDVLYERRLVGLSVVGKVISGLQERVNITMNLTTVIHETQEPRCVFYNFSTEAFSSDGCLTLWKRDQHYITCSCNHLTNFGVLMVTPSNLSPEDTLILKYITLIGCSLSLFGLIISLLLFITNKKLRTDVSTRVHISLAIALILLNVHFLISQQTAALSSTGFCFYIAIALHYSLLASFSWMALEGFHLYILLVRVFNIYISRYLLKLSLVGWGVPAVIVSLVVIIDKDAYGHAPLNPSNPNDTTICYITNNTVKDVTTIGAFGLVFIFNMTMLVVTIRQVLSLRHDKEFGQSNYGRVKGDILVLLGISILLGITWGLVFFSFGSLTTPGLYLFCILNSLQGFFIFLWFVLALRKTRKSATMMNSEIRSTS